MTLLGAADIRSLAATVGVRPSKARGQNFVVDGNTIRRIVRLADLTGQGVVLEVGPGLGSLTLGLLAGDHQVVAVEIDPALADQLPATVTEFLPDASGRLSVITADAGAISHEIADEFGPPTALVANLPYNVAVPVLLHCLIEFPSLQRSLVMVQLEVADRLAAPPGSRDYGVPSVKAAWFGDVRRVGTVPAAVFWPVPRVESGLVRVDRRSPPVTTAARAEVFGLVDLLFAQRRKMVRAVLGSHIGREAAAVALAKAEIDPTVRPENLALADFCRLAESIPPQ
ncbi:MAG: 16S rRNA (adenine(1518)-N(6)/adenine(1519)-N(6))-dimethyltransferase RsmA [Actinomycetia bacterium]|nr:16S rRNA (adenine(1518)-N(6)/adenine(1519)-N(6))-dimethyltransferase RsmA [Actinomycetes bacterium]MCH9801538.1 16S rRNA (adenine(1518)-N(6)/adenine(1519)-N(6))-dimethyltransferase RsmA [Actinomycetes bacterium]